MFRKLIYRSIKLFYLWAFFMCRNGFIDKIYIGEIVGTHGIKGEVRLISTFREKEYA